MIYYDLIIAEAKRKRICCTVSRAKYSVKRQNNQWAEASAACHCWTRKAHSGPRQKRGGTTVTSHTKNCSTDHCKHARKVKSKGRSVKEISASSGKSQRGILLCCAILLRFVSQMQILFCPDVVVHFLLSNDCLRIVTFRWLDYRSVSKTGSLCILIFLLWTD